MVQIEQRSGVARVQYSLWEGIDLVLPRANDTRTIRLGGYPRKADPQDAHGGSTSSQYEKADEWGGGTHVVKDNLIITCKDI